MKLIPTNLKDFYKTDHRRQYPRKSRVVYSNMTPRKSRYPGVDSVVVFGIQYFIKRFLQRNYQDNFFGLDKDLVVNRYKRRLDHSLGKSAVPIDHVADLHDLQHLPLSIKSLPEGTLCPIGVPFLTIRNTLDDFYWLTNDAETLLSNVLWPMITSATTAFEYRKVFDLYAHDTSDNGFFTKYQGHDFSFRGMFGPEAGIMSGASHLLSFRGTDTMPAIDFLEDYYNTDCEKEEIGVSVPATEHSVMCMGGNDNELETIERLITEIYPTGIVSVVCDTWDYWKVITQILPKLKDKIMKRDGKLVIRPDSGDPVDILCGQRDAEPGSCYHKGTIECLWDIFGGEYNNKGFRELDSHIGVIYGDSITLSRAKEINHRMKSKGFSTTNHVLGIGSFTYQHTTRDVYGFAVKSTYGVIDGKPVSLFKDPKTDSGEKTSAKGLLMVDENLKLHQEVTPKVEKTGLLAQSFLDGALTNVTSLSHIRIRIEEALREYVKNERGLTEEASVDL